MSAHDERQVYSWPTLTDIRGFPKLRPNKFCQISQKYLTLTKTLVGIELRS